MRVLKKIMATPVFILLIIAITSGPKSLVPLYLYWAQVLRSECAARTTTVINPTALLLSFRPLNMIRLEVLNLVIQMAQRLGGNTHQAMIKSFASLEASLVNTVDWRYKVVRYKSHLRYKGQNRVSETRIACFRCNSLRYKGREKCPISFIRAAHLSHF